MSRFKTALLAIVMAGCGGGDGGIDPNGLRCEQNSDCGDGWVCGTDDTCLEGYKDVNGVTASTLTIGNSSGTVTGNATSASTAVVDGIKAVFKYYNDRGGVHGRELTLDQRDDGYDPTKALANVKAMTQNQSRQVFALLGNYGSATVESSLDTMLEHKTVLFGAITGSGALRRTPPDRYVFNFRAGAEEQSGLAVRYLTTDGDLGIHPRNIAIFAQGADNTGQDQCSWNEGGGMTCLANEDGIAKMDAFGRSGFDGAWKQLKSEYGISQKEIIFATYTRNKTDVEAAAKHFLKWLARAKNAEETNRDGTFEAGIILQAVRVPSARLVEMLVDEIEHARNGDGVSPQFELTEEEVDRLANLTRTTFVGTALSKEFSDELLQTATPAKYCKNVLALQIVPDPVSSGSLVLEYREHLQSYDRNLVPDAYSLEGYVAARIFVAGLEKQGAAITTESFVDTLEGMSDIDIGLGVSLGFNSQDHQASHTVWARKLNDSCEFESFTELSF